MKTVNLHHIAWSFLAAMVSNGFATPTLIPGTWVDITPPGNKWVNDVQFAPSDHSIIYIVNYIGSDPGGGSPGSCLSKSTDGGSTWKQGVGDEYFTAAQRVRIDPKDPDHLYVICGVHGHQGFFESKDGGATWHTPAGIADVNGKVGNLDLYMIDVDPTDFKHFLLSWHYFWDPSISPNGADGVVETFDGGATAIIHPPLPGWSGNGGHNIFFLYNPTLGIGDAKTWLFCTQAGAGASDGFYRTTDAGAHWTQVATIPMVHGGTQIYYAKSGILYAATSQFLCRSPDNGATWQKIPNPDNSNHGSFCVWGDGTNLHTIYDVGGTFYTSPEIDGQHWKAFNDQSWGYGASMLNYDEQNGILYAAKREDGVWALRVSNTGKGITLLNPRATPSSVPDNSGASVTVSVDVTAQNTIASVLIDLRPVGGKDSIPMIKGAGNTYSAVFTVPLGSAPNNAGLPVRASDTQGHAAYALIPFTVADHGAPVLVSRGRNAVASSTQSPTVPAGAAVDGDPSTRWSSNAVDPSWIYVDLGSQTAINRVVLKWETAYATGYKVQVSNDATNWIDVYSTTTGDGGVDSIGFAQTSARYVRMYGTARGTAYGYSLFEFEVLSPAPANVISPFHKQMVSNGGMGITGLQFANVRGQIVHKNTDDLPRAKKTITKLAAGFYVAAPAHR